MTENSLFERLATNLNPWYSTGKNSRVVKIWIDAICKEMGYSRSINWRSGEYWEEIQESYKVTLK